MTEKITSEYSHSIIIKASAAAVLNYVSNPNSWPKWLAASHEIHSEDKPLEVGEKFVEQWHTKTGPFQLDWLVTERDHPFRWTCETTTPFTGPIIVTYTIEELPTGEVNYTRIVVNPDRPKPIADAADKAMHEEAAIALQNIKTQVEKMEA